METMRAAEAGLRVVLWERVRTMEGLTLIKGLMEGRFPAPPISEVLGFDIAEAESGRVVYTYTPVFGHYNPLGTVHGGVAATLLDSVMGCCIHTTLKAGIGFTTLEIKVNYVRAMTDKTGPVWVEGKVISAGSPIATSEGKLYHRARQLLPHATPPSLI